MSRSDSMHKLEGAFTRRRWLRGCGVGLLGLSLPNYLALRGGAAQRAAGGGFGRARACIVLYCWGGVSQLDTWDLKPQAPAEVRGEFKPLATSVPGIHFGEHMPRLARQMDRLAVVRSVHHLCTAHGKSMYWNRTGHAPPQPESRDESAALGQRLADAGRRRWRGSDRRSAVCRPPCSCRIYWWTTAPCRRASMPGWLGNAYAPLVLHPNRGKPYAGISREAGDMLFGWPPRSMPNA